MTETNNDSWVVAELMGHVTLAGRITKPGEYGGLWQIDIPEGETFRTEFFGSQAVYRIRIVSEEIARAYARPGHEVIAYDAPIITREEHQAAMDMARQRQAELYKVNEGLRETVYRLESKLHALPAGHPGEDPGAGVVETWEDEPAEGLDEDDDETLDE